MLFYQGYVMYQSSSLSRQELQDLTCCHAARITHPSTLNTLKDVEDRSEKLAYIILLFTIIYMVLGFIGDAVTLEYAKEHGFQDYEEEEGTPTKEEIKKFMIQYGYLAIFLAALCYGACCMVCFKFAKDVTEETQLAQKHIVNYNASAPVPDMERNYGAVN